MADANEASGQHMLAEAAQELACGERHDALLVAMCIVFPSEAYVVTIEAEQAPIADGDAVGVAAEIAQHANGISECRLGIDHPVDPWSSARTSVEGQSMRRCRSARWSRARYLPRKTRLSTFTGRKKAYLG